VRLIEYQIEEYEIERLTSFSAVSQTFRVTNNGTTVHNFVVGGQGIEKAFETNLSPGETQTYATGLATRHYEVYCPVGNHREEGMEIQPNIL
jgi:hypothetical protein